MRAPPPPPLSLARAPTTRSHEHTLALPTRVDDRVARVLSVHLSAFIDLHVQQARVLHSAAAAAAPSSLAIAIAALLSLATASTLVHRHLPCIQ